MKESLIERLKLFLYREDNLTLVGHPASQEEISQAEQLLNVSFHTDYVKFIQTFGGAYAGIAVHAFANGSSIGKETVIDLTLRYREQFKEHSFAKILETSYVISMDGSGDPIMMNSSGQVYIGYHDTAEIRLLADSFEALIEDQFYEW
ncbi:SMI1/KNR4 family protein [Paenibacillus sp. GCM10028914]|uniref:SMI1/KNR4 family protein n=1 Tax=Paenibacillus sp. GCM10028914 TaxID=3273416 RepID=UPI003619BAB1